MGSNVVELLMNTSYPPCRKQILNIVRECDYGIVSRLAHSPVLVLMRVRAGWSARICRVSATTRVCPVDTSLVSMPTFLLDSSLTNARWGARHIQTRTLEMALQTRAGEHATSKHERLKWPYKRALGSTPHPNMNV